MEDAIQVTDAAKTLLSVLNQFYLETRYPGDRSQLAKEMDKIKANGYLIKTKEAWKCLRQTLL